MRSAVVSYFAHIPQGSVSVVMGILCVLVWLVSPQYAPILGEWFLIVGLVFPGIPHGALDHALSPHGMMRGKALTFFVLRYLFISLAIIALWMMTPLLMFVVFLLYSAWHFGETDMQEWHVQSPLQTLFYGIALLGGIIGTHAQEFLGYTNLLHVPLSSVSTEGAIRIVGIVCIICLIGYSFVIPQLKRTSYILTLAVVLIGTLLPLVLAFALYFIGIHSVRAWKHLRQRLSLSQRQAIQKALPLSLGAYIFFLALVAVKKWEILDLPFDDLISGIVVFLAAISAPHIWYMHSFYQRRVVAKNAE
jgi:Brp/Blh family beta-carotene 15,15'-monooxygenase